MTELAETMNVPVLDRKMTDKLFQSKDKHKSGVMPFQVFHEWFLTVFASGHLKSVFDPVESSTDSVGKRFFFFFVCLL